LRSAECRHWAQRFYGEKLVACVEMQRLCIKRWLAVFGHAANDLRPWPPPSAHA
jgi:hypothetical protein